MIRLTNNFLHLVCQIYEQLQSNTSNTEISLRRMSVISHFVRFKTIHFLSENNTSSIKITRHTQTKPHRKDLDFESNQDLNLHWKCVITSGNSLQSKTSESEFVIPTLGKDIDFLMSTKNWSFC